MQVPDGGHALGAGAHHLVRHQLGELQVLLILEGELLLEELSYCPDLAVGEPPAGGGDHQAAARPAARLQVADQTLVTLKWIKY